MHVFVLHWEKKGSEERGREQRVERGGGGILNAYTLFLSQATFSSSNKSLKNND